MRYQATLLATIAVSLTGCAATHVAISKRDLDVQTRMSATIFLEPVKESQRSVFVQIRNTSDQQELDIGPDVSAAIAAKGYRLLTEPDQAQYIVQANVLQVGRSSAAAAQQALAGGYGGPMGAAVMAATASYAVGGSSNRNIAGVALIGAAADLIGGAMVKDVYYTIITDIQIKERIRAGGGTASLNAQHQLGQGTSGGTTMTYQEQSEWKAYQTRIVSTANKVNLEFAEAGPALRNGLARSLSGLF